MSLPSPRNASSRRLDLVIELGDVRRQRPLQVEGVALVLGESGAFVQNRIVEQLIAAQSRFDVLRRFIAHVPAAQTMDTIAANRLVVTVRLRPIPFP